MDNKEETADVHARRDDSELLQPGTDIKPGAYPNPSEAEGSSTVGTGNIEADVKDFNNFVTLQDESAVEEKPKHSLLHIIWEIVKTLIIAAIVVIFINTFVFQAYYVDGGSMNPDFINGDYLLVDKIKTSLKNINGFFGNKSGLKINRGDVLVFRPPGNTEIFYIKRVIGLPGDRITLKDGVFTIYNQEHPKGLVLKEAYVDPSYKAEGEVDEVIEANNVFVVGDNRSPGGSYDSRSWGQLPQANIIGNAFFRVMPLNDAGFIQQPSYN